MNTHSNLFEGRTVLVTGGSSGIGKSVSTEIARKGGTVIIFGRDVGRLESAVKELPNVGHRCVQCDVSNFDACASTIIEQSAEVGGFDGVCHAAGVELIQATRLMKAKNIEQVLGPTLYGGLAVAHAASKSGIMKKFSSIVFVSSVAARRGKAGMALYSASRAGLEGLTKSLAAELAPRSIRVNAIMAGAVETPMHERIKRGMSPDSISQYAAAHPLGFGQPADVAQAAAFLLSEESRWITATSMYVDGGFSNI